MAKKKTSKEKPKAAPEKNLEPEEDQDQFGGLPNRDLKKNLGCGG